uniref:Uncharacterized protein n=1 Tax=Caenorhabditis japonica TaxID=281687 RepID=A0A8R1IPB7_CAEJA
MWSAFNMLLLGDRRDRHISSSLHVQATCISWSDDDESDNLRKNCFPTLDGLGGLDTAATVPVASLTP